MVDSCDDVTRYKRLFIEGEEVKVIKRIGEKDNILTLSRNDIKEVYLKDPVGSTVATTLTVAASAIATLMLTIIGTGGGGPTLTTL